MARGNDKRGERRAVIRGVPFRVGRAKNGLYWGMGEVPAPGGVFKVVAESQPVGDDPATRRALYKKLGSIMIELEALLLALGAEVPNHMTIDRALYSIGGTPSRRGAGRAFLESEMPTTIMGPGPCTGCTPWTPGPVDGARIGWGLGSPVRGTGGLRGAFPKWGVGGPFDFLGDAWDTITHPDRIPGALANVLAHPGDIVKPLSYGLMLATGPVGVAATWAADRAGLIDGAAKFIDATGGILTKFLSTQIFAKLCKFGLERFGWGEAALGCLMVSISIEFANAIATKNLIAMLDVVQRLKLFTNQYNIDPTDIIKGLLDLAFRVLGDDAFLVFGQLDKIQESLERVLTKAESGYIINLIKEHSDEIKARVAAIPADAKGSLDQVKDAVAGGKIDGKTALERGLQVGPAHVDPVASIIGFAPRLSKHAKMINTFAAAIQQGVPPQLTIFHIDQTALETAIVGSIDTAILTAQSDAEILDFVSMLSPGSVPSIRRVVPRLHHPSIDPHSYSVFVGALDTHPGMRSTSSSGSASSLAVFADVVNRGGAGARDALVSALAASRSDQDTLALARMLTYPGIMTARFLIPGLDPRRGPQPFSLDRWIGLRSSIDYFHDEVPRLSDGSPYEVGR